MDIILRTDLSSLNFYFSYNKRPQKTKKGGGKHYISRVKGTLTRSKTTGVQTCIARVDVPTGPSVLEMTVT